MPTKFPVSSAVTSLNSALSTGYTKKSVVITFKQRRWKHSSELDVFLNGNRLPNKEEITNLGVVMNDYCMVQSTLEARKENFMLL